MDAAAGCILAGCTLGAGMGAGTVWTSPTPMPPGNAGMGGGGVGQDRIRAARSLILCIQRLI